MRIFQRLLLLKTLVLVLGFWATSRLLEQKGTKLTGAFLGVPYDFRPPTLTRLVERVWNPQDPRIFTPHFFGWGWSMNLYTLVKRLGFFDYHG